MDQIDTVANNKSVLKILLGKYGVLGTLNIIWSDVLFDFRNGVDTFKPVSNETLFSSDRATTQNRYVPSTFAVVAGSLDLVKSKLDLQQDGFVDIGSGKGKVMIAATRYGFKHAKGVEYTDVLNNIALANMEKLGISNQVSCVQADASTYPFEDQDKVLYFFNPFVGKLMDGCIENILVTSENTKRIIIYVNPVEGDKFDAVFDRLISEELQPGGVRVNIYQTK